MNPSKDAKNLYVIGLVVLLLGVVGGLMRSDVVAVLFSFFGCVFVWVVGVQVDLYGGGKGV